MTRDGFDSACRADLDQLDQFAQSLVRLADAWRTAEVPDRDALEQPQRTAAESIERLRRRLAETALTVGEEEPCWESRAELDAIIARLGTALAKHAAERPRQRLRGLVQELKDGRIFNRRTGKLVTALEEVRVQALAEVERALHTEAPPELPGPEASGSWLHWAWEKAPEEMETALSDIRGALPHLVQLILETDPSQWEVLSSERPTTPPLPSESLLSNGSSSQPVVSPSSPKDSLAQVTRSPQMTPTLGASIPISDPSLRDEITPNPVPVTPVLQATPQKMLSAEPALPPAQATPRDEPPPTAASLTQAASAALRASGTDRFWLAREVVWHLLDQRLYGLAVHLAGAVHRLAPSLQPPQPPWLLRAMALAPCLRHPNGDVARRLQEELAQYSADECFVEGSPWNGPMRLLLTAACLRPALLAPEVGTGPILKDLHFDRETNSLFELCRAACEFTEGRQPLDLASLKQTQDRAAWEERFTRLIEDVKFWLDKAPHRTIKFQAATIIWQRWVREGPVQQMLAPILASHLGQLPADARLRQRQEVAGWAAQLTDESWLRNRVDKDDDRAHKRRSIRIIGAPFDRLVANSREAATLAQRWLDLEQVRPAPLDDFRVRQAQRFHHQLQTAGPPAIRELEQLAVPDKSTAVRAAASISHAALADLYRLFDSSTDLPSEDGCARRTLHRDFLRIPGLPLGDDGTPHARSDGELVETLLRTLTRGLPSWGDAFRARAVERDHFATELILEPLAAEPGADVETLKRRRDEGLRECHRELEHELNNTRKQVEEAVAFGLLGGDERNAHIAEIRAIQLRQDGVLRFGPEIERLRGICSTIAARRSEQVEQARHRVVESGLPAEHPAHQRIDEVLDRGDVFSANDYLEMALRGEELPALQDGPDLLANFFPNRVRELDECLGKIGNSKFLRLLGEESVCGLDLSRMHRDLRDLTQKMIEAWFSAVQRNRITDEEVRRIFTGLGLAPSSVRPMQTTSRTWFEVHTEPIRDRALCPLPVFGSGTNGRYRVLCVWGRPSDQELISPVGETHSAATYVFYFGRMSQQRRRDLARLRCEHRRTFLILDDILVAYLAGERLARLPVLFACGLPFTYADPYPIAASLVPPEMFYGRQRERDSILQPFGTCFIYGGRQLGKTALLRDAERTFNRSRSHIAVWLDLKDARVGIDRDLWPFLAEVLKARKVLKDSVPPNIGPDKLLAYVQEWLEADATRRLLLLLDEADQFLKKDSDGGEAGTAGAYARVTKLKGLMDRTNRRFKVVFAGLHNVQRTTRLENHPLAHYGEPICIGPLLDNGEWREARALVERPFGALGYRFASPDLVTRILSHTNYYPSLIQLYCNYLLRHVTAPGRVVFDPKTSPPYFITEDHVEAAYQSEDLRKAIRDRFTWTLQLDERYEVLANVIAYHTLVEDPEGGVNGLTVAEAREKACAYWLAGFAEGSEDDRRPLPEDAVQALLDEMVGLGVLRKAGGRYALRSPNVRLLMGSEENMLDTLTRPREPSLDQIDPAQFRAPVRRDGQARLERRSPLTAAQESELRRPANGVTLLFGTDAAGFPDLPATLEQAFGAEFIVKPTAGDATFSVALERLSKRRRDGLTLLWVGTETGWTPEWVSESIEKIDRLSSDKAHVRVAFAADPSRAWEVARDAEVLESFRAAGVRLVSLEPWHDPAVRQWLQDCQFGPSDKEGRDNLRRVTGNWPLLLADFHRLCQSGGSWRDRLAELETELHGPTLRAAMLRSFGLSDADRAGVLRELASYAPLPEDELANLIGDADWVESVLRWAELLRLADQGETGWRLDPVVAALLPPAGG